MVEIGIVSVIHLMEGMGIDGSNFDRHLSQALTEYRSSTTDIDTYFMKTASILSNAMTRIDRCIVERIFSPWEDIGLESCGRHYSFWLLMEQIGRYTQYSEGSDELYEWLDKIIANAVVHSGAEASTQLWLMLKHCWFSEKMRNRICLWIFYNVVLGEMRLCSFPQSVIKEAADHTSLHLGRDGLAKEIQAFKSRSEVGVIADN